MTSQRYLKKSFSLLFLLALVWVFSHPPSFSQEPQTTPEEKLTLLDLLGIVPSAESIDYIQDKTQFQLHTLLTEQRHRKTWSLSERIQKDYESGLRMLFSVDEDIVDRLTELAQEEELFEMAIKSIQDALLYGRKIYVYGCGATGRLAKQMESTFWRPFWKDLKDRPKIWPKGLPPHSPFRIRKGLFEIAKELALIIDEIDMSQEERDSKMQKIQRAMAKRSK